MSEAAHEGRVSSMFAGEARLTDLYASAETVELLRQCAVKGFALRFRPLPKTKAGGTWIAQVSNDGRYLRAQHVHPTEAVRRLVQRIAEANRGVVRWRQWGRRPWSDA
jgi:hypothetical protein